MSKTIDEKVVELRFDNQQFEQGVKQTQSSVKNLKKDLKFEDAGQGLSKLERIVNTFSLMKMTKEITEVSRHFSLLGQVGSNVLNRITNGAIDAGKALANRLGIGMGAIKDGFHEYELEIGSVQTMLTNMARTGNSANEALTASATQLGASLRDLTRDTILGKYGNGVERVKALGDAFEDVQKSVNQVYKSGKSLNEALKDISGEVEIGVAGVGDAVSDMSKSAESDLDHVTRNLAELNTYADKTVYSFADMTSAIGQFMTAGVDLDVATQDIQGLGNIAAAFGVKNEALTRTYYQLSQAISAGKIQLMDWRSVINANMSGPLFRDEIVKTAEEMGAFKDNAKLAEEVQVDFNGSLRDGWFTADILNAAIAKFTSNGLAKYLSKLTGAEEKRGQALLDTMKTQEDVNDAIDYFVNGNEAARQSVTEYVNTLNNVQSAATKVRTLTQLLDVTRESIGTGWADTWRMVIGNFNEATDLFTGISDAVNGIIQPIQEARNALIKGWKDDGGRDALIEAFHNLFNALKSIIEPAKEAWGEVFKPLTSKQLVDITNKFRDWTANLRLNAAQQEAVKQTAKSLFGVLKGVLTLYEAKLKLQWKILSLIAPVLGKVFIWIGKVAEGMNKIAESKFVTSVIGKIQNGIDGIYTKFQKLGSWLSSKFSSVKFPDFFSGDILDKANDIKNFATNVKSSFSSIFNIDIYNIFSNMAIGIDKFVNSITEGKGKIKDAAPELLSVSSAFTDVVGSVDPSKADSASGALDKVSIAMQKFGEVVSGAFKTAVEWLKKNVSWDKVLQIGELFLAFKTISSLDSALSGTGEIMESTGDLIKRVGKGVYKFLNNFSKGLKAIGVGIKRYLTLKGIGAAAKGILAIAAAIAVFTGAIYVLGNMDGKKLEQGMIAMTGVTVTLFGLTLAASKLAKADPKAFMGAAVMMMGMGIAMTQLAKAVKMIADIKSDHLADAIAGVAVMLGELIIAVKLLDAGSAGTAKATAQFLALAAGLKMLGQVIKDFAAIDFDTFASGFAKATIGIILLIKSVNSINVYEKGSISAATNLFAIVMALTALRHIISSFGKMDPEVFVKGGIAVALTLKMLTMSLNSMLQSVQGFKKGTKITSIAATLIGLSIAISSIAGSIKVLGNMNAIDLAEGLISIKIVLFELKKFLDTAARSPLDANSAKIFRSIALSVSMLALAVTGLGLLPIGQMAQGIAGVSSILLALGTSMRIAQKFIAGSKSIVVLAGAVTALGVVVMALSAMPTEKVMPVIAGLTAMMLSLSAMMAIVEKLGKSGPLQNGKQLIVSIGICIGVISAIGGILTALITLNQGKDISGLLPMVGSIIAIIDGGLIPLLAAFGVLAKFKISGMIKVAIDAALAISAFSAIIGAVAGVVGFINDKFNGGTAKVIQGGLDILKIIFTGLGEAIGGFVGGIGTGVAKGLTDLGVGLSSFWIGFSPFIEGASDLAKNKNAIKGTAVIADIIKTLSEAGLNSVKIDSLSGNSFNVLTALGQQLPSLGENLVEFQTATADIDEKRFAIIGKAMGHIGDYITALVGNKDALSGFNDIFVGAQIRNFIIDSLMPMVEALKDVPTEDCTTAAQNMNQIGKLVKPLAKFQSLIPEEGFSLKSFIFGGQTEDYDEFGKDVSSFVGFMLAIVKSLSDAGVGATVSDSQFEMAAQRMETIGNFSEPLTKFKDVIPYAANTAAEFTTHQVDWTTFGSDLSGFVDGMRTVISKLTNDSYGSGTQTLNYEKAKEVMNALGDFADPLTKLKAVVPTAKSLKSLVVGGEEIGWDEFSDQLSSMADGFNRMFEGLDNVKTTQISHAAAVFSGVLGNDALGSKGLQNLSSLNLKNLKNVATDMQEFGESIEKFMNYMDSIDDPNKASNILTELVESIEKLNTSYGDKFKEIGENFMTQLQNGLNEGAKSKETDFTDMFNSIIDSLSGKTNTDKFYEAGKSYTTNIIKGIKESGDGDPGAKITEFFTTALTTVITNIKSKRTDFYSAGSYLDDGFINGIKSKIESGNVYAAGYKLGNAAYEAARKALDEHSPSKKMFEVGKYAVQGFVNGINHYKFLTSDAAIEMTSAFTDLPKDFLSKDIGFDLNDIIGKTLVDTKDEADYLNDLSDAYMAFGLKLYSSTDAYKKAADQLKQYQKEYKDANSKLYSEMGRGTAYITAREKELKNVLGNNRWNEFLPLYKQYISLSERARTATGMEAVEINHNLSSVENGISKLFEKWTAYTDNSATKGKKLTEKQKKQIEEREKKRKEELDQFKENLNDAWSAVKDGRDKVSDAINAAQEDVKDAANNMEDIFKEMAESGKEAFLDYYNTVKQNFQNMFDLMSNKMPEYSLFSEVKDANGDKIKSLQNDLNSKSSATSDSSKSVSEAKQKVADLDAKINKLQAESNKVNGRSKILNDEIAQAIQERTEAENELAEAEKNLQNSQNEQMQAAAELAKAQDPKTLADEKLKTMKANNDQADKYYEDLGKLSAYGFNAGAKEYFTEQGVGGFEELDSIIRALDAAGAGSDYVKKYVAAFNEEFNRQSANIGTGMMANLESNYDKFQQFMQERQALMNAGVSQELMMYLDQQGEDGMEVMHGIYEEYNKIGDKAVDKWNTMFNGSKEVAEKATDATVASLLGVGKAAETAEGAVRSLITQLQTALSMQAALGGGSAAPIVSSAPPSGLDMINSQPAVKAVKRTSEAMIVTAKKTLKVNSPSKVFMQIGKYVTDGFVIGLMSGTDRVKENSESLATNAINPIKAAMQVANNLISNVDTSPTIMPHMNLSEIQNGAQTMHQLLDGVSLNTKASISLASDVNELGVHTPQKRMQQYLEGSKGTVNNDNHMDQNNTFNITGDNPKEIANQVDIILSKRANRRKMSWA